MSSLQRAKELYDTIDKSTTELVEQVLPEIKSEIEHHENHLTATSPDQVMFRLISELGWDLADIEKHLIKKALEIEDENIAKAAKRLGITWQSVQRRMVKYGIQIERKRQPHYK